MDNKVVVFDFDKTLSYKDTLFGFFYFVAQRRFSYGCVALKSTKYLFVAILCKLKLVTNTQLKQYGIKCFLKNMKRIDILQLGKLYASSIRLNEVYKNEFFKYPNSIVVSASFEEYLKPIFYNNPLLASKLMFDSQERVIGLLENCYSDHKVLLLKQLNIQSIDIFYTDSFSDKPLMDISEIVFLVKKNNLHQLKP
jgi:phosphatidylglycerophosphatase C